MKQTLKIVAVSALVTAGIIKAVPVFAEPAPSQNVSIVHTFDLNLSSRAGQETLDHRLVNAALEVCGSASDVDLAGKRQVRTCRSEVLKRARADTRELARRDRANLMASGR